MNIFFAINSNYVQHLLVAIASIIHNNKKKITFNICSANLKVEDKKTIEKFVGHRADVRFFDIQNFDKYGVLPRNIPHTSIETYFRYLIPYLDKKIDKALYLDADVVVKGSLRELWETDITGYFAGGVFDEYIKDINYKQKIGFSENDLYVNAGVLLLNLKEIRDTFDVNYLFDKTVELSNKIKFQDQDVLNIVFKGKILRVPQKYNYATRDVTNRPKRELLRAKIVHFTGRQKPWDNFFHSGNPAEFYYFRYLWDTPYRDKLIKYLANKENAKSLIISKSKWLLKGVWRRLKRIWITPQQVQHKRKEKIKVALLIDEFFGGAGTAFGGYGFLARRYIAKYIPCKQIELDVILGFWDKNSCQLTKVDGINVYRLPKNEFMAKRWLREQNYDLFFSIELTTSSYNVLRLDEQKRRLLLWIQDPRPWYEWREINTVKLFPETCYWNTNVYEYVNNMSKHDKVRFITQGKFLISKAKDLYRLINDIDIDYVPNPVELDLNFDPRTHKKQNKIIFLGRIESVKRGWLFCEIARRLPNYDFYLLGQTFREKDKNNNIMNKYRDIKNLHFAGHVDGEVKINFLKDAKILVNTSIHEALPISFLEALSYGTLLVSNRNPEELTERFGIWVGDVFGDGFDKVDLFVNAIVKLMSDEKLREEKSISAVEYIRQVHNIEEFETKIRKLLLEEANKK